MLKILRGHHHLRNAIPNVDGVSSFVQSNEPRIEPRAQREHRKRVAELSFANVQQNRLCLPCPNHLLLVIAQSYAVVSPFDCLPNVDRKLQRDRFESLENMWFFTAGASYFPAK